LLCRANFAFVNLNSGIGAIPLISVKFYPDQTGPKRSLSLT